MHPNDRNNKYNHDSDRVPILFTLKKKFLTQLNYIGMLEVTEKSDLNPIPVYSSEQGCKGFCAYGFVHLGYHIIELWELHDIPIRCLLNFVSAARLF